MSFNAGIKLGLIILGLLAGLVAVIVARIIISGVC